MSMWFILVIIGVIVFIYVKKNQVDIHLSDWYKNTYVFVIAFILALIFLNRNSLYWLPSWIPPLLVLIMGYLIYRNISKGKIDQRATTLNQEVLQQFYSFGTTKEEREKKIKNFFDNKMGSLKFSVWWGFKGTDVNGRTASYYISFTISRNLSLMDNKERELLGVAFQLFNEEKISQKEYSYFVFTFVNGNGKASIDNYDFHLSKHSHPTVKDGTSAVKFYQDHIDGHVDGAANAIMTIIDSLGADVYSKNLHTNITNKFHGGHTWLNCEDIPTSPFKKESPYSLTLGKLDGQECELSFSGEGSLITIAPPGSGKTQCFVLPNMLSWPGAALVLDVKGEIHASTHKWRAENVGPVYKFSPSAQNSNSYNPLFFIRQESDYLWEDARFLADMMIVPSGANDPFWENSARDVLTAAIAYVCMNNAPEQRPMGKVLDILYGIEWEEMVMALKMNVSISAMRRAGHSLSNMEKKTLDSVLKTAQSSMSAWQGESIDKVTRKSDWSPLDLRTGKPTIYICVNPNEIDSYLSILRVFIAQHIRMLTTELPPQNVAPVLFMLDELPRLKKMPPVDEALNVGRQYGIKLWMFAQSYGQLKEAYPDPERLLSSCVVRTYMNIPLNDELATKLSDQLGYREGPLDASRQKLVEPRDLAGPNYRDIALIFATNTKPAKVSKAFAFQNEALKKKMS